jgi:hypothetical protein
MICAQTVGQHAHRVATLYCELWGLPRAEVLYYVLHHDGGELSAGDIPFGGKKLHPQLSFAHGKAEEVGLERQGVKLPGLSPEEHAKFKICDLLEMWETGVIEENMGNKYATPIVDDTRAEIERVAASLGPNVQHVVWGWFQTRAEVRYER